MRYGICQCCGGIATQTCSVCGGVVCIKCNDRIGCRTCRGIKK